MPGTGVELPRILGDYTQGRPGPTVVICGGVHGNEPSGALVARHVIQTLQENRVPVSGRVIGVAGNLPGLKANRRYLDRDLNRLWHDDDLTRMAQVPADERSVEDNEQIALLETFGPLLAASDRPVVFLDLHTTSGNGAPFAAMADVLRNRPIALSLPLPVVLGLEEAIDGTMLGFLCDLGHVGVAVEGGQHDAPETREHHESMTWLALVASGAIARRDVPDLGRRRRLLASASAGLPRVLEIRHRHHVGEDDEYEMEPGFENFSAVARNQKVASDVSGDVLSPEDGLIMLPRYQRAGDDGYFLARPVRRVWLSLSAMLRRLRLHGVVRLLPGISRHPQLVDHVVARRSVARRGAPEIFHLFGYRRMRWLDDQDALVFTRRRPDHLGPQPLPRELQDALANGR